MHDRFLRSQILQALSSEPVAMWYPFGEKSMPKIDLRWPSINITHRPVRRSHTRPKESWPPVATTEPSIWKLNKIKRLAIMDRNYRSQRKICISLPYAMNRSGVTLLMQDFSLLFQIPQTPRGIVTTRTQESTRRMESQSWNSFRLVSFNLCQWFFTFSTTPQFDWSCKQIKVMLVDQNFTWLDRKLSMIYAVYLPSLAQVANMHVFETRSSNIFSVIVAFGWKTMQPTLQAWPFNVRSKLQSGTDQR